MINKKNIGALVAIFICSIVLLGTVYLNNQKIMPKHIDNMVQATSIDYTQDKWLDTEHKARAESLISVFENSTPIMQYDYAEYLDDGRGITAGRAGFCSGTGDAHDVVKKYTELKPNNPLAKYLPELERLLTAENKDDITGLKGYEMAWAEAAKDLSFKKIQDEIVDQLYYRTSQRQADRLGLKYNLSRAALYDASIMHGNGDDRDSLPALIRRTNNEIGGSPAEGVDEKIWLAKFLELRKDDMLNPFNQDTKDEWSEATDRVQVFQNLIQENNWDLNGPIKINVPDWRLTIE